MDPGVLDLSIKSQFWIPWVERVFKEADSVNKRMKAGSRMQRHAQRDLKSSAVPCIRLFFAFWPRARAITRLHSTRRKALIVRVEGNWPRQRE